MRSRNPVYPLPQGAFSVHINGDHNHVSRYKSYSWMETGLNRQESFSFGAMPGPIDIDVYVHTYIYIYLYIYVYITKNNSK